MLTAVGLGPGDPGLLTLHAVSLLKNADTVFVPGGIAKRLVAPYCDPIELLFPMSYDNDEVENTLLRNADRIAEVALDRLAVFGIIGDPLVFSTFSRLCTILQRTYPDIDVHTVPGVSSVTAVTSAIGLPVTGSFSVSDGSPYNTHIRMKVTRPREVAEELYQSGYDRLILVERMFMDDMAVYSGKSLPETSNYFSILYAGKSIGGEKR